MTSSEEEAGGPDRPRAGVVVLGSLNMDLSVTVARIARPGETVLSGPVTRSPGGKGANQAFAAAQLGGDVRLIGRLGRDEPADTMRAVLEAAGVDLTHVRVLDHVDSGLAFVTVDADGENAIVVSSGANAALSPAEVERDESALDGARIAVAQLETPIEAVRRFAELCGRHGVQLILNAAPYRPLPPELLRRVDYLVLNRDEAAALTGLPVRSRAEAGRALAEAGSYGAGSVVITLGGDGCVARTPDGDLEFDACPVRVVDTTGAGDAFVGALAVSLARGAAVPDALAYAVAAGAAACARPGAQVPTTDQEVRDLLSRALLSTSLSTDG